MKNIIIIFLIFISTQGFSNIKLCEEQLINNDTVSQKINLIIFNYAYQIPNGRLSDIFFNNNSIGVNYLAKKNNFIYGLDINFMWKDKIKNDGLLDSISTTDGYLINASGQLDEVLLYQRGINTHMLFGWSFTFPKRDYDGVYQNNQTGIYLYGGPGYLQHNIRLESDRTNLPQIHEEYIKGYDNLTSGLSHKICLDFIYLNEKTFMKFKLGVEFINALTRNRRPYNFSLREKNDSSINWDQLFGIKFGIIIPINRSNEEKFHYR